MLLHRALTNLRRQRRGVVLVFAAINMSLHRSEEVGIVIDNQTRNFRHRGSGEQNLKQVPPTSSSKFFTASVIAWELQLRAKAS